MVTLEYNVRQYVTRVEHFDPLTLRTLKHMIAYILLKERLQSVLNVLKKNPVISVIL